MRPILKLFLGENGFEQFEGYIFVRIAFHVEINESAHVSGATQQWPQLGREVGNGVRRVGRIYLRIEGRNFDRKIYDREKCRIFAQGISPVFCFAREALEQIQVTRRILVGLRFIDDSFSQEIDSKSNFLGAALPQRPHDIV